MLPRRSSSRGPSRLAGVVVLALLVSASTLGAGEPAAAQTQEELLPRARAALEAGDVDLAVRLLEEARSLPDADARTLFYLGRAYLAGGRYTDAAGALREARTADPENVPTTFWLGVALIRTGELDAARRHLAAVLAADPGSLPARLQLGWILLLEQRGDAAVDAFRAILEDHPDSATAWYYLGFARHGQGHWQEARQAYGRSLELDPSLADARVALARLQSQEGDPEAASRSLEAAIAAAPDHAEAHHELGRLALRQGDPGRAVELLERAVRLAPEHAAAHYQLARAYRRAGRDADADAATSRYSELRESERRERMRAREHAAAGDEYERAGHLLAAGDREAAIAAFREAIRLAGDAVTAAPYVGLGTACLELGNAPCAADALERAADLDPDMALTYRLLARAYDALERPGDAERARRAYRRLSGNGEDGAGG